MKLRIFAVALAFSFYLGIEDGYIALWKDGLARPVEIFPIRAEMLPESDQKRLNQGIRVENAADLAGLMEDYLS